MTSRNRAGPKELGELDDAAARGFFGRIAAVFFILSGVLAFIPALLYPGSMVDRVGTSAVGAAAILLGVAVWFAPWQRWSRRTSLWLIVPPGLVLIALANLYGGSDYHTYAIFFVLAFVWIGLAQPPGTSLLIAPLAVIAYLLPISQLPGNVAVGMSTVIIAIPLCIVIGEGLAQGVKRVRVLQGELVAERAEVRRLEDIEELSIALRGSLDLLQQAQAKQRDLMSQLVSAEEEERRRIAIGLHDDPAQTLTVALLRLQTMRRLQVADEPADSRPIEDLLSETLAHLRSMMFELRPESLDQGLASAVDELIQRYGDTPPSCELESSLAAEPPDAIRTIAFRIIAEAVSNAHKHAQAEHVQIRIGDGHDHLSITVRDDGIGIDPAVTEDGVPGHFGLPGMIERAEIAGGSARISRGAGGGTTVEVQLPLEPNS